MHEVNEMNIEYNTMRFTEVEKEKLNENKKKIIAWIMDVVIPNILPDDCISIDFGDDYRCPRSGELTTCYHLDICGGESIMSSHKNQHVLISEKFGNFEPLKDIENNETIYSLIENWTQIKKSLECAIAKRKDIHNKIENFEV